MHTDARLQIGLWLMASLALVANEAEATFSPDWQHTVERLSQRLGDHRQNDQQLQFRQESLGLRNRLRVYQGWARFSETGQFRWQRQQPSAQVWSFDGEGLIFGEQTGHDRWQVHVASNRVARELAHITSLLSDFELFLQSHRLAGVDEIYGGPHGLLMMALQPSRGGDFSQLGLVLDAKLGTPHSLEIEFHDGRRTRYFFSQARLLPHDQYAFRFLP